MKSNLVLYYSKTGNSKFVADKIAKAVDADTKEIETWLKPIFPMYMASLLKMRIGNIKEEDVRPYKSIIIIGPVWGGSLISPLRDTLLKCVSWGKNIYFALTCETPEEEKNGKFGFAQVLNEAKKLGGLQIKNVAAFSTSLVKDADTTFKMNPNDKIKFSEENFDAPLQERLDHFVDAILGKAMHEKNIGTSN